MIDHCKSECLIAIQLQSILIVINIKLVINFQTILQRFHHDESTVTLLRYPTIKW